jgi:hypothetical protein
MGNLGAQEVLLILIIIVAFPVFFYWLGRRSGYKQGQLDMYRKMDEERKGKN